MPDRQTAVAFSVAPARAPVAACLALAVAALAGFAPAAQAQYKWIGPDGRVNYGDRPPPVDTRRVMRAPAGVHASEAPAAGDHRLPYALRSAADRYPVVLYTAPDCDPCEMGRDHLTRRGVPFTEKRVQNAADVRAFEALKFGTSQFPVLTVGTDRMVGFEAGMWNRMLDSAAYPRSSMLPPNYLARTLEPMSPPPQETARVADEAVRAQAARGSADVGGLLIPAQQERIENPIRF